MQPVLVLFGPEPPLGLIALAVAVRSVIATMTARTTRGQKNSHEMVRHDPHSPDSMTNPTDPHADV
jgi:hypothetical protein